MATFETRTKNNRTSYRVKWREDGQWQSATFTEKAAARRFKKDVELYDNRWPETGWVRVGTAVRAMTQADVAGVDQLDSTSAGDAGPVVSLAAPGTLFGPFAVEYVRDKTGLQPDTRTRYANQAVVLGQELDLLVAADSSIEAEEATVENITSRHIARWINAREQEGASPKTVRNWHGLLYQVLQAAVDEGLRASNPCVRTGRSLPRRDGARTGEQKVFLTPAEFALIADAMWPGLPDPDRDGAVVAVGTQADRELVIAAVGTGARWGELTALLVSDVQLRPIARVSIEKAWKNNGVGEHARQGAGKKYLGAPKTLRGRRRVRIAQTVADLLEARGAGRAPSEYVFFTPTGGPVKQGYFYRQRWLKAVSLAQRNGLTKNPRFHDLRHTYAAWLISAGVPLPEIQQRLGHESITTTVDTYGGLLEEAGDLADQAVDAALGSLRPDGEADAA